MKRFLLIVLCSACLLTMFACAKGNGASSDTDPESTGFVKDSDTNTCTDAQTDPGNVDDKPTDDNKTDPATLTLQYDDRYVFKQKIKSIENVSLESRNLKTGDSDSVVSFKYEVDKQTVIASGVGKALITFESGSSCTVTVEKAKISMLLIFGQSNGEGWTKKEDPSQYNKAISQSVLCEEGQIYSTYAPSGVFSGIKIGTVVGGVDFNSYLTVDTYKDFVPESLTSDKSVNGKPLDYKLNSLSKYGQGKSGIDSALAYKWHEITGEKVWVINASHGASNIASWQRGGANFSEATLLVKECERVLKAEIDAGHYVFSKMGYFWAQGCSDVDMSCEEYTENFKKVHRNLKDELAFELNADMQDEEGISFAALIMPRTPTTHVTEADLALSGLRASYFYMGMSAEDELRDVWLASVVGDDLVTDERVKEYFIQKYKSGKVELPLRTVYALPTTANECHPDIHYRQPGFNEIGSEAAERILNILNGISAPEQKTISVYKDDGVSRYADGETIRLRQGKSQVLGIRLEGAPEYGKLITIESENADVSVSYNCITVSDNASAGIIKIKIFADGELALTLNIEIPGSITFADSGNSTDVNFEDLFV